MKQEFGCWRIMINSIASLGAQWGDEGKGKIVDLLTEKCDAVVIVIRSNLYVVSSL